MPLGIGLGPAKINAEDCKVATSVVFKLRTILSEGMFSLLKFAIIPFLLDCCAASFWTPTAAPSAGNVGKDIWLTGFVLKINSDFILQPRTFALLDQ